MSDTKETDEKKSLSLSKPGRLELKKSVEYGQVRQSFSRGRTKAVAVERVKKRSVGRNRQVSKSGVAPEPKEVAAPTKAEATAPPPEPDSAVEATGEGGDTRARVVLKSLTEDEKAARAKALEGARKADEEARRRAEEEARRQALEEARRAREQAEAERRKAE